MMRATSMDSVDNSNWVVFDLSGLGCIKPSIKRPTRKWRRAAVPLCVCSALFRDLRFTVEVVYNEEKCLLDPIRFLICP
jgi:hypothetical protein